MHYKPTPRPDRSIDDVRFFAGQSRMGDIVQCTTFEDGTILAEFIERHKDH